MSISGDDGEMHANFGSDRHPGGPDQASAKCNAVHAAMQCSALRPVNSTKVRWEKFSSDRHRMRIDTKYHQSRMHNFQIVTSMRTE
jgi:hypothetical protein